MSLPSEAAQLWELLESGGRAADDSVKQFVRAATAVQAHRFAAAVSDTEQITRSTALWTLMMLDPAIAEVMLRAGLDLKRFGEMLSIRTLPEPAHEEAPVHPDFANAMRAYLGGFSSSRPLAMPDVAIAILRSTGDERVGLLTKRLNGIGSVDVDVAIAELERLADSRFATSVQTRPWPEFSDSVRRVLDRLGPRTSVTSGEIALAMQALHPEYGGAFGSVSLAPSVGVKAETAEWLNRVASLYDETEVRVSRHQVIDGELLVSGLAELDPTLAGALKANGFLDALREGALVPRTPTPPSPSGGPAEGDSPPVPVRAGYSSDEVPVGGERITDHLDVTRDAEALAWVITAEEVEPPLSIGLFGDWGSGKTTFMRLLETEVNRVARDAKTAHEAGKEYPFCENVRHIWFNAWHYTDANLWASLVSHILEELGGTSAPARRRLVQDLASSQAFKKEAVLQKGAATARREAGEKSLQQTRIEKEQLIRDLDRGNVDLTQLGTSPVLEDARKKALGAIGRKIDAPDADKQLQEMLTDVQGTWPQLRFLWKVLRAKRNRRWLVFFVVLIVVAVGFVAAAFIVPALPAVLLATASAAGAVISYVTKLRKPISTIGETTRSLTDAIQSGTLAEIQRRQQDEKRLEGEVNQAKRDEEEADREIKDIDEGRQFSRYVEERLRSDDYRKFLGIIALIRKDFERLSQLMVEDRNARRDARRRGTAGEQASPSGGAKDDAIARAEEDVAGEDDDGSPTDKVEAAADPLRPQIDRIILYIDDLDRCPSERVVEVLEAVHLLLAFRLFVVIVGVDSRWLFTSLNHHYWSQFQSDEHSDRSDDRRAEERETYRNSTPQNYLEKIFQIPFAMRRMEWAGYKDLVSQILETRGQQTPKDFPIHEDADGTGEPGEPQPPPTDGGEPSGSAALHPTQSVVAQPERVPPTALFVEKDELVFLVSEPMAKLVPTPRAAKRLANTYRLLRASLDADEMQRFLPQRGGEFRIAGLLLGTVIGFPNQAESLFRAGLAPDAGTWWGVVDEAKDRARADSSSGKAGANHVEPIDAVEALDRETWGRLHEALTAFRQVELPEDLQLYRHWIPKVGRFSFQTGLLYEAAHTRTDSPADAAGPER